MCRGAIKGVIHGMSVRGRRHTSRPLACISRAESIGAGAMSFTKGRGRGSLACTRLHLSRGVDRSRRDVEVSDHEHTQAL